MTISQQPNTYLAFYIGSTRENKLTRYLWDGIVTKVDGSPYSHVELAVKRDDGLYNCYSSSYRDKGVRCKVMDLQSGHWELVPVTLDLARALQVFYAEQGKPYDFIGLFSTKHPWWVSKQNAWFCSEICACMCGIYDYSNYGVKRLYDWARKQQTKPA